MIIIKTIVLCGGRGLRINELTETVPKPLIEVCGKPILYWICNQFKLYGFNDFIFCLGYKGNKIKEYFKKTKFNIKFVNTGTNSTKAQRLIKVKKYIKEKTFFLTYGDDICHVDIKDLIKFHTEQTSSYNRLATLVTVRYPASFGIIRHVPFGKIMSFEEKPLLDIFINGGYYVLEKRMLKYLSSEHEFEEYTINKLIDMRKICAYDFEGFWKSVNTIKDVQELNEQCKILKNPDTK